jgi:hypothetical protein
VELPRLHGSSNLNTFRDGFRVLRTIARERLRRRPAPDVMVPAADSIGPSSMVTDSVVEHPVHVEANGEHTTAASTEFSGDITTVLDTVINLRDHEVDAKNDVIDLAKYEDEMRLAGHHQESV